MSKWEKVRLSDVFDLQMGKTPSRSNNEYWQDGSNKWISIADIGLANKFIINTREKITDIAVEETGIKPVPINTVIMSFKLSIGKICIVPEKMYTNEAIMAFINKGKYEIDINFLYYLFSYMDWEKGTNKAVMGATLNKTTLSNFEMYLPPIEIQKQIARNLDTASELLAMRKRQFAELDNLIKSVFYDMFGDPVINEKGWRINTLRDICNKITDGTHNSPNNYDIGKYKYITAKNIKKDGFDLSSLTYVSEEDHKAIYNRCNPQYGDILYIKDGVTTGIAQINTLDEEFSMLSSVALLKQNRDVANAFYLREVLNNETMYTNIRRNMGGAAITRLTISKIEMIEIPIPPLSLQNQFSEIATKIEEQKSLVKMAIDETQYLFDSLMNEYFEC